MQLAARGSDGGEQDGHLEQPERQVGDKTAQRGKPVRRLTAEAGRKEPPVHPGRRAHRSPDLTSAPQPNPNEY
jgi:hypothetical protein